jgi:hypothetical protein
MVSTPDPADGFFSRWSRRKTQARQGDERPGEASPTRQGLPGSLVDGSTTTTASPPTFRATVAPQAAGPADASSHQVATTVTPTPVQAGEAPSPPAPTLDDVARLPRGAEVARFVGRDVDPAVRNAALHKLFSDPAFNVMDGLDIYIDDYGRPDPLPASMLRQMVQSRSLGLFDEERDEERDRERPSPAVGADVGNATEPAATADAPQPAAPPTTPPVDTDTTPKTASPPGADPGGRPLETMPHEDADLRLQPHHADGPPGQPGHGDAGPEPHTRGQR